MTKDTIKIKGNTFISHQAIMSVVYRCAIETYGVVGIAPKNFAEGLARAIVKDTSHGIDIHYQESKLVINVYIIIEYGTRIKTVASLVADNIIYRIEKLTGLSVAEVNVHVRGLRISNTD